MILLCRRSEVELAPKQQINKVLSDMRTAIDQAKFLPVCRKKNMQTLASLGLTWVDARSEIYSLQVADYFKGPEIDRDYPTTDKFWIFKKNVLGKVIYIKFKILYQSTGQVKLVSFHIDESP